MALILEREAVLAVFSEAASRGWPVPAFGTENRMTTEAILSAGKRRADELCEPALPICIAVTNRYRPRSQTLNYTHTRRWQVGLRLLLSDLAILAGPGSPFSELRVLLHLDHISPGRDRELLGWDMGQFSSIMFDASGLDMAANVAATARFVEQEGARIVIEGACDEITEATCSERTELTRPDRAAAYARRTGADMIVANLGTEHRARGRERAYRADLARAIKAQIGPRLVLHGGSSLPPAEVAGLFEDGVCKVNVWTSLERDSAGAVLEQLITHASKVVGARTARALASRGLLGSHADVSSARDLSYYTTHYRERLAFGRMKRIVKAYLDLWYR